MRIEKLSEKQKQILKFAHLKKYKNYNAIICDGAVRSGKTVIMIISFIHWAMRYFNNSTFAICGKTISSTERNIIEKLFDMADISTYFKLCYSQGKHKLTIKTAGKENTFFVFGGKDKNSYSLIQGLTLSGVFFDEVALQQKSFVQQAIARTLSEKSSKLWFNCNPEHPQHWFYKEWIKDADGKNSKKSLHLHFLMEDNPILGEEEIEKAKNLYSGVFKERYIYGKWVMGRGLVYPMFNGSHLTDKNDFIGEYYISIDYGTTNPFSMGLWVVTSDKAIRIKEFYYDSKKYEKQLTDEEYYNELLKFSAGYSIKTLIIDPSAASFIQTVRQHRKFRIRKADNNVINGIRLTASLIKEGKILINRACKDIIREFSLYSWDEGKPTDTVKKQFDHAMDEMRYFCATVLRYKSGFSRETPLKSNNYFDNLNYYEEESSDDY